MIYSSNDIMVPVVEFGPKRSVTNPITLNIQIEKLIYG